MLSCLTEGSHTRLMKQTGIVLLREVPLFGGRTPPELQTRSDWKSGGCQFWALMVKGAVWKAADITVAANSKYCNRSLPDSNMLTSALLHFYAYSTMILTLYIWLAARIFLVSFTSKKLKIGQLDVNKSVKCPFQVVSISPFKCLNNVGQVPH